MTRRVNVAVLGYGNIGKHAADSVDLSPDMRLAGIVELPERLQGLEPAAARKRKVVESIDEFGRDVALCIPSGRCDVYHYWQGSCCATIHGHLRICDAV